MTNDDQGKGEATSSQVLIGRLRRDLHRQWVPANLPVCGLHRQQRLDRAARPARQVEGEDEAATRRFDAVRVEPRDIRPRQFLQ